MFANIGLLKFVCLSYLNTLKVLLLVDEVEVGQQLPLLLLYVELQAVQVLLVPLVPPQELLELLQLVLELLVVLPLQYELVLYDLRPLQGSCVLRLQLLCTQAFLLLPLLLLPCSCSCSLTGLSELPPPSLKVLLLVDEVEVGQLLPLLVPVQLLHLLLLVDEHHKEEEDQVDVVQVDEEDLLLNFLVLVVKENLLLLLIVVLRNCSKINKQKNTLPNNNEQKQKRKDFTSDPGTDHPPPLLVHTFPATNHSRKSLSPNNQRHSSESCLLAFGTKVFVVKSRQLLLTKINMSHFHFSDKI